MSEWVANLKPFNTEWVAIGVKGTNKSVISIICSAAALFISLSEFSVFWSVILL